MGQAGLETMNRHANETEEGKRQAVEVQETVIAKNPATKRSQNKKAGQLTHLEPLI